MKYAAALGTFDDFITVVEFSMKLFRMAPKDQNLNEPVNPLFCLYEEWEAVTTMPLLSLLCGSVLENTAVRTMEIISL